MPVHASHIQERQQVLAARSILRRIPLRIVVWFMASGVVHGDFWWARFPKHDAL
jgi:hypothetical protein